MASEWHSLYDELMPNEPNENTLKVIDDVFKAIGEEFGIRQYFAEFNRRDKINSGMVRRRGNHGLKLAMILWVFGHEKSLRDQIVSEMPVGSENNEKVRKPLMFYRLLSIAVRSLYETPYDESNVRVFVSTFLEICMGGWITMDAAAMSMYCDFFAARCQSGFLKDDGGLFDLKTELTGVHVATLEEIAKERNNGVIPPTGTYINAVTRKRERMFESCESASKKTTDT